MFSQIFKKSVCTIGAIVFLLQGCSTFGSYSKSSNYMYGLASYYGGNDGFENRKMANGKIFHSSNIHLSAHPTLALGTKLKVINLKNSRVLYVEVTDRMPLHNNRVIDLSKGGAQYLGFTKQGITKVQLTVVSNREYKLHI